MGVFTARSDQGVSLGVNNARTVGFRSELPRSNRETALMPPEPDPREPTCIYARLLVTNIEPNYLKQSRLFFSRLLS